MLGTNVEDSCPPLFTQTIINIAKFPANMIEDKLKERNMYSSEVWK